MRKLKLYIAISLDGYIAKPDGSVEWLESLPNPEHTDYGYTAFYETVDTLLMGNATYKVLQGFNIPWPYPGREVYVFTRDHTLAGNDEVKYVSGDIVTFIQKLKDGNGKDIWLVGGGQVNMVCLQAGLIDEIWVHIMPVVLGEGIPLLAHAPFEKRLQLQRSKVYASGAIEAVYTL